MISPGCNGADILKMYDLLGVVGARYKFSHNDFSSEIKLFLDRHKNCGYDCEHKDFFLKKILVTRQIQRMYDTVGYLQMFKLLNRDKFIVRPTIMRNKISDRFLPTIS